MLNNHLLHWATLALMFSCCGRSDAVASDLSGQWKGRWKSCVTGHEGPLKADFCRINGSHYKATFRGRFFKVLPFKYSVTLRIVEDGATVKLRGSEKLGRKVGVFHYQATADRCIFHADYCSKDDRGYFHLQRR